MNRLKLAIKKILYKGSKHYCYACKSNIKNFLPYGVNNDLFEKLEIVGGGFRKNVLCPICKSSDRDRLLIYTLDKLRLPIGNFKILHIAPEPMLAEYIPVHKPMSYIKGDKFAQGYNYPKDTINLDITSLPFEDNLFDFLICNHVLEHIGDEKKALNEISRVLSPKGVAILQVPIALKLANTLEDEMINTCELREKSYGQKDHVRLYGLDYYKRLENHGFEVENWDFHQHDIALCYKLGLNPKESVTIIRKVT